MARRLVRYVDLVDQEGNAHLFSPGDELPEWAAELITNPKALAPDDESGASPEGGDPERPPLSGKGSGRPAWAGYAASLGVEVTHDMTREDIVAAVEDATAD